jgi:tetratricopeptide (TPR) repeat protein
MKALKIFLFLYFFIIIVSNGYGKQLTQKDFPQFYIDTYNILQNHPLVSRAHDIFNRVKNAADKTYQAPPTIVILKKGANPPIVLKIGTILISQNTLEKCYGGQGYAAGDARLAFIFGHELAHLANTDYWIEDKRQFVANQETSDILKKHSKEERQMELKADAYGMIYASMAGFHPDLLLNSNGEIFFHDWTYQIDTTHPSPKARAAQLKQEMLSIRSNIDLFHIGLRLYQLGKYKDALPILKAFQRKFPCREVSNLIGLIYYQQAINYLSEFNEDKAFHFKLGIILDMDTRANLFRYKSKNQFQENMESAILNFKIANEKDLQYVPSRVNLSAALILIERYSGAIDILDQALKIEKDSPEALNNRAVALYLLESQIKVSMFQQSVDILKQVIETHPKYPDTYYNLAQIMKDRQRASSYKIYFNKFLELEPFGIFALNANKILGIPVKEPDQLHCAQQVSTNPPIMPGDEGIQVKKLTYLNLKKHVLPEALYSGEYYTGNGYLILVLEGVVELVEIPVQLKKSAIQKCKPLKYYKSISNKKSTSVFDHWAFDIHNDMVIKKILF